MVEEVSVQKFVCRRTWEETTTICRYYQSPNYIDQDNISQNILWGLDGKRAPLQPVFVTHKKHMEALFQTQYQNTLSYSREIRWNPAASQGKKDMVCATCETDIAHPSRTPDLPFQTFSH